MENVILNNQFQFAIYYIFSGRAENIFPADQSIEHGSGPDSLGIGNLHGNYAQIDVRRVWPQVFKKFLIFFLIERFFTTFITI